MNDPLTREEVFAACDVLVGNVATGPSGVTGHAVCKKLGRGSRTTVYRYTEEWKKMRETAGEKTALRTLLASVQRLVVDFVDNAIQEERSRATLMQDAARDEIAQLGSLLVAAHKAQSDAHLEADELREQIAALEKRSAREMAELQAKLTVAEAARFFDGERLKADLSTARTKTREAEQYADIVEMKLKQELQDTREEFAYQILGDQDGNTGDEKRKKRREVDRALRALTTALPIKPRRTRRKPS